MIDDTRRHFGLTQAQMAEWLGVARSTVALAENGHRLWPVGKGSQNMRLSAAALGFAADPAGAIAPLLPGLPPPELYEDPFRKRSLYCRYHLHLLRIELGNMRARAQQLEARLAALPTLRAWPGPVPQPAQEARWLDAFEAEAMEGLCYDCGAGPQRLLEARIAGLERELELLQELVPAAPTPE